MTTPQDTPDAITKRDKLRAAAGLDAAVAAREMRDYPSDPEPAYPSASQAQITWDELTDGGPDSIPEVLRFVLMNAGALDSLHREVDLLAERLAHVLIGDDADPVPHPALPEQPRSFLAGRVAAQYHELIQLTDLVVGLYRRLGV